MPLYPNPPRQHPGYIASRFYATIDSALASNIASLAIDTYYFYMFIPRAPVTFVSARARCQTLGAGSSMKTAIYGSSPVSVRPLGAPIFKDDTGVTTQASTTDITIAIAGTMSPGVPYWIGTKFTGTLPVMWTISDVKSSPLQYLAGTPGPTMNATFLSFADTYSNNAPTIAEGATFAGVASNVTHLWLAT